MWDDAFPSFLIGLREGLEAGTHRLHPRRDPCAGRCPLPAAAGVDRRTRGDRVAMSFGAVLTFTAASLSATAQEAFGGTLSVSRWRSSPPWCSGCAARPAACPVRSRRRSPEPWPWVRHADPHLLPRRGPGRVWRRRCSCGPRPGGRRVLGPLTGAAIGLAFGRPVLGPVPAGPKINLTKFFTATGAS